MFMQDRIPHRRRAVSKGKKKKRKPLSTKKVRFAYSDQEVLRDISLNLNQGELVAIIGKSGSGKSTLLKLIGGIISLGYGGKIRIFGRPKFLKKSRIGFVPQESAFIPDLSLADNIRVIGLNQGVSESRALVRADEYLQMLKLDESLNKKPGELSGGQRVRFNIVLSLLHDPDLLILDEPFVGLDFKNRRLLWHFLEKLRKKGKSIVLTSHLLTEIQEHVSRIVILRNGKIFFSGNLEKLKEKLKIHYLLEYRFTHLSRENMSKIKKYCAFKEIEILDFYERYIMFGINDQKQQRLLEGFFGKLNLKFQGVGFREPNLDEIFMKE
jgi:ABC-2 type transport system ATP-binding protein